MYFIQMLPLMGGPLMMFIETYPFLRKLDFLFGYKIKQLQEVTKETNNYIREVSHYPQLLFKYYTSQAIKSTNISFNADNQPSSYIEAFLAEQKKREEAGKPMGEGITLIQSENCSQVISTTTKCWTLLHHCGVQVHHTIRETIETILA